MKPFSAVGAFWLPEHANRTVSGRLTFDGNDIEVMLFDSLTAVAMPDEGVFLGSPRREGHPRLFGRLLEGANPSTGPLRTDHHVTLVDVTGIVFPIPAAKTQERWYVDTILVGAHTHDETTTKARLFFDALPAWANPPWLVREMAPRSGSFTTDIKEAILHETTVGETDYRIVASTEGTWGLNVHLDRLTSIAIATPYRTELGNVHSQWARAIHDLLILCIGAPVALNEVRVEVTRSTTRRKWRPLCSGPTRSRPNVC